MKPHKSISEKVRAQVTEFLFEGMPPDKHAEFEGHLGSCETCRNEVASQRGIAVELGFAAPTRPQRLKNARQPWRGWQGARIARPLTFVAGGPEGFEPTAYPGVTAKRLFVDQVNDRVTMMVRMAPKASYPAHKHAGVEECYVVEGDLKGGAVTMHAGDYQRADAGSLHPVQSTDSGCVLFVVSSMRDEVQD